MIKLDGFKEISKTLKAMESKVAAKVVRKGVAKMAQVVRKDMRKRAPRKSGKLKKELRYKITRSKAGGFTAAVGAFNGAYYANFIEKGTKRHSIKPKNKRKVLSFGGRNAAEVTHPGTNAKPFIEPAFIASRDEAVKQAGKAIIIELSKLK
ncbi:HK97-gp10 family putative phage morphogenesis protein [Paraglaciecola sp.]|uniref:HK97-gp10 family putative phage morphogenesis protein n=1 Tax=Paraglaciecola sp. TaxID=1920173 RepID=UPI003EF33C17